MTEQKVGAGTMRDDKHPAPEELGTTEDVQKAEELATVNGKAEEEEDKLSTGDEEDEQEEEDEEILDEHEPDKTRKVRERTVGEGGVTTEKVVTYTIKEMGRGKMTEWMKIWSKRLKKKGFETDEQFDAFLIELICRCTYGPDGSLVKPSKVKTWGPKLKFAFFQDSQEVNGLTDSVVKKEGKG